MRRFCTPWKLLVSTASARLWNLKPCASPMARVARTRASVRTEGCMRWREGSEVDRATRLVLRARWSSSVKSVLDGLPCQPMAVAGWYLDLYSDPPCVHRRSAQSTFQRLYLTDTSRLDSRYKTHDQLGERGQLKNRRAASGFTELSRALGITCLHA